jgi:hypothetical protein
MAETTRSFGNMLNDYLANDLLKEEFQKDNYLFEKLDRDDNWSGQGDLIVPFKSAGASSVKFGGLTGSTDIAEDVYVRGKISTMKEVWGSMIFNHRDLMEHEKLSEQNLLKILPGTVEDFMEYMKTVVAINLLNGKSVAKLTVDGTVGGVITLNRPDRLRIGQKLYVDDDNSAPAFGYVRSIDINTKQAVIYDARSGGAVVDLSAYTVAQNAKVYNDGQQSDGFLDLKNALLSAANGGDANLYGQVKTASPYTQAINIDGSGITAVNILESVFDALTSVKTYGRGKPTEALMSLKNFGSCVKSIEGYKGAFNVMPGTMKATPYAWSEIVIGSSTGDMVKLVGLHDMDDDFIPIIDWRGIKFHSNGFFKKRTAPDGKQYFEDRLVTGYVYIVDICLFGEFTVNRPSYQGIIHSIDY